MCWPSWPLRLHIILHFLVFSVVPVVLQRNQSLPDNLCAKIEKTFSEAADSRQKPICQCLRESPASERTFLATNSNSTTVEQDGSFWVGCTHQKMPAVFRALVSLNNTQIAHLHIWDSLINILPNDMFSKIRADKLTIETSRVGVIRKGAFTNVGKGLKALSLKNNILKGIESKTLANLTSLVSLDLSGNKLEEMKQSHLSALRNLEVLLLNGNQLAHLEDGLFEFLTNLKILNLANNKLKKITRDVFKGLVNLETLSLNGNHIESIDKAAFIQLKSLKFLDLGNNRLTKADLGNNTKLGRLILSNNHISALDQLGIQNLSALSSLHLDRNQIHEIADADLVWLAQSPKLSSLSLDGNNISRVGCGAFESTSGLAVLSLQRNKLTSLTCAPAHSTSFDLERSMMRPLRKLRTLILSYNNILQLNDDDFVGLLSLADLSLDHNKINQISKDTFHALQLRKLFINNNRLYFLPEGIFTGWNITQIQAVDISENPWECICGYSGEWIGNWLATIGRANTPSGTLGCLIGKCETLRPDEQIIDNGPDGHDVWMKAIACVLASVAILFLVVAGYVYVQESHHKIPISRASSDTIRLISSQDNIFSFPNPVVASIDAPKQYLANPPPLSILASKGRGVEVIATGAREMDGKDGKRVRFND